MIIFTYVNVRGQKRDSGNPPLIRPGMLGDKRDGDTCGRRVFTRHIETY